MKRFDRRYSSFIRFGWLSLLALSFVLAACGDNTATTASSSGGTAATAGPSVQATGSEKPSPFRIGLIPNQNPDTVKTQYKDFKTYMEKELGQPVELFVGSDYPAVVQAIVSDKIDMAYFGGLTYLQAREQGDVYPIITDIDKLTKDKTYTSVIIVPASSPVQKVEDLKGKTFAFGDASSTSGSLYPRIMLDAAGIKLTDLKDVKYTGGHDATALAVQNGTIEAGGLEERILLRLEEQGKIDPAKVRIIKRSDPIPGYPWVVRAKLDKAFVDKVTNTFLNLKDPELLKVLRVEGYTKTTASDYTYAREQAIRLGLLITKK